MNINIAVIIIVLYCRHSTFDGFEHFISALFIV